MNIGNASNAAIATQPQQPSAPVHLLSHTPSVTPSPLPTIQSTPTVPTSSTPLMPLLDAHESNSGSSARVTNLVKPSFFSPLPASSALMMPPISSSIPTAPPLHPPANMQRPYGTPLLQPFPPPAPPPSLTPSPNYDQVITRDKVRDALLRLVQVIFSGSMLSPFIYPILIMLV